MRLNLSTDRIGTMDELYSAVALRAQRLGSDRWVLGWGYDELSLGGHPDPDVLDRVAGGRPVWLLQASHHGGTANRAALSRIGLSGGRIPEIDGGYIGIGPDGLPTGVLADRAMMLIDALIKPVSNNEFVEAIAAASQEAVAKGLTSITEPGLGGGLAGNSASDVAAFQTAYDAGKLDVRVTVMPEISALHDLRRDAPDGSGFGLDLGLRSGLGDDWLRVGGVKIISDGALTMHTAALCGDYLDMPGEQGMLMQDSRELHDTILRAAAAGWQVATHAIGDRAVEAVLRAYEAARAAWPDNRKRHRIEHAALATDGQIARMRTADVIPVPQARFLAEFGHNYLAVLGEERCQILLRQRSFLEAGIQVPGSSDCPVVDGSPLLGMHDLVNRRTRGGRVLGTDERIGAVDALRAFTIGSAYADHQEHRKGTLSRGKLADFVVLSDDPLAVDTGRIGSIGVVATIVGGEVRHGELVSR